VITLIHFENAKVDADKKNWMERGIEILDEQFREDTGRGRDFMKGEINLHHNRYLAQFYTGRTIDMNNRESRV
jgi:hypothetical protein